MGHMKTQCSKSWTDINIDFKNRSLRHCCKAKTYDFPDNPGIDFFDNSSQIQERRQHTLNGIQHQDCNSCWSELNSGNPAYKDWMNAWTEDEFNARDLSKPHVNYIEIELDNTCDLSCVYCNAESSSKIAQEENIIIVDNTRSNDIEQFKLWLEKVAVNNSNNPDRTIINFLGGEPTASKLFYELLDAIQDISKKHPDFKLQMEICTNCNSKKYLMDKLIACIDSSSSDSIDWAISISNESYGDDSELIRYGLNWNRFVDNLVRYITHPKVVCINFSITINALSLRTFAKYIDFVQTLFATHAPTQSFGWIGNYVSNPDALDIKFLSIEHKQHIIAAREQIDLVKDNKFFRNYSKFSKFLTEMERRIASEYNPNYKKELQEFIDYKQRVKRTNKLTRLIGSL
jgi:MoaA/NifB/PqqE/SkfB family radical SAM enzyme